MDPTDNGNSEPISLEGKEQSAPQKSAQINRRNFITALGAVSSAVFLEKFAKGSDGTVWYEDSFGNIVPASAETIAAGVYPPPISTMPPPTNTSSGRGKSSLEGHSPHGHFSPSDTGAGTTPTFIQPGYVQPNILMIMVDQLRTPRWLPPGGQATVDAILPNIAQLRNHSFIFPNYFVAAVACTPSRATLLTGLYSQQTAMFRTQGGNTTKTPSLNPGFPTFANALSGVPGYNVYWMGKWHLSDPTPLSSGQGTNGPKDYGFTPSLTLNFPATSAVASPNGYGNLGTEGYNPSGFEPPLLPVQPAHCAPPSFNMWNDAAVADIFINTFIGSVSTSKPWCATVSFMNPHDITAFPYAYGVSGPFGVPVPAPTTANPFPAYGAPDVAGHTSSGSTQQETDDRYMPVLPTIYSASATPDSTWNVFDNPRKPSLHYNSGAGKPSLQLAFQGYIERSYGAVTGFNSADSSGWLTFLNYYFWMQASVDYHIGTVLRAVKGSQFWGTSAPRPLVIVFLADHGDYGGSHWLKAKGGALYDEVLNVPLYLSYASMRTNWDVAGDNTSVIKRFVCSSVDILPYLYTVSLGNSSWRSYTGDIVAYLGNYPGSPSGNHPELGRESIVDGILSASPIQRRNSGIPNNTGSGMQPYVLHTMDEFLATSATDPDTGQTFYFPNHAIAFRTVDPTVTITASPTPIALNGGGKLGMYSYWPPPSVPPQAADTQPNALGRQFEFYDYTVAGNVGEQGNNYTDPMGRAQTFVTAFGTTQVQAELYNHSYNNSATLQAVYAQALADYEGGLPSSVDNIFDIES